MVVVTVVVTRVVDEVEVEAEAAVEEMAQRCEAGEAEDEAEGLRWRFIRQSSSPSSSTPTKYTLLGPRTIPSLLLAPKSQKWKISSRKAFRLAGIWASGPFK